MVFPVPGWGWCPVIAVVELSSTTSVMFAWLYTAFTMPVIAEAKNVESPTKAKQVVSGSTLPMPWVMLTPAPMQRQVSTISSGMALPSV